MTNSKIYLNVPYAQKDAVKALGARWDAVNKKWYISSDLESSLFIKWQVASMPLDVSLASKVKKNQSTVTLNTTMNGDDTPGVFTYPADKDFIAYDGDVPPWS
jgi:hypothetical protein